MSAATLTRIASSRPAGLPDILHAMQSPLTTDRGKLRMERVRQLELEQLQWDQEALVMPEDLNRALLLSFESVKTEFSDLDGLSWPRPAPLVASPWALEEPTSKAEADSSGTRTPIHSPPRRPPAKPYGSPRADTSHYSHQETVRVARHAPSRSPLQPANQFFATQYASSRRDPHIHSALSPTSLALACRLRH